MEELRNAHTRYRCAQLSISVYIYIYIYIYITTTATTTQCKLQNKCSSVCVHINKCLVGRGKTPPVQVAVGSSRMDASHVCTLDNALVGTRKTPPAQVADGHSLLNFTAILAYIKRVTFCFVPATDEDNCMVVETFGNYSRGLVSEVR